MNQIQFYPARLTPDEDGRFVVSFPDYPEALTDGATKEEALYGALDCLEEAVAGRINRNEDIPSPSTRKRGMAEIYLSPQFALKALLYQTWKEAGITRTELAARLCVDNKEARRLLDPHYGSKLPKMSEALKVLGHRVVIGLEKCA